MSDLRPSDKIMLLADVNPETLPSGAVLRDSFRPENFLGAGSNARVYKIDDYSDLALRVPHVFRENDVYRKIDITNFRVDQERPQWIENQLFQGKNYGQPLATFSDGTAILRKQPGTAAGLPHYLVAGMNADQKDILYETVTLAIGQMPQQAFTKAVDDIRFLNGIGKAIDPSKPDNLLYDTASMSLNFVDLVDKTPFYDNSPSDLLIMSFYGYHDSFYNGDGGDNLIEARKAMIEKTIVAAEELSVPFLSQLRLEGELKPGRQRLVGSSTQDSSFDFCLTLAGYKPDTAEREAVEKRILLTSMPEAQADFRLNQARSEREAKRQKELDAPIQVVVISQSATPIGFGSPI